MHSAIQRLGSIVEVPASRRLHLDIEIPPEVPTGATARIELIWSPKKEAIDTVVEQLGAADRAPISHYFGILSPDTYGDGVAYQRKLRDEWDD